MLATGGDTHLGGDDLDRVLARRLLEAGLDPAGGDALAGGPARGHGGGADDPRGAHHRAGRRRRRRAAGRVPAPRPARPATELEALIQPVIERTTGPCRSALRDAGLGADGVDGVVLVGGTTRTPAVRRHVKALFGREPLIDLDPDTVVALGAAVQADALDRGGREDVLLLDVIPLSLGVEMMGGVVEKLILRNSTIPASASQQFTTYADSQTGMVIHVVQGERELARDCRSLARFTLKGIPPMPAGVARVEITYAVDADGILQVAARELATGLEQAIQVKPTYGLGEDEVEAMLIESIEHAEADVTERFLREWRVEAERILAALESAFDGGRRAALGRPSGAPSRSGSPGCGSPWPATTTWPSRPGSRRSTAPPRSSPSGAWTSTSGWPWPATGSTSSPASRAPRGPDGDEEH